MVIIARIIRLGTVDVLLIVQAKIIYGERRLPGWHDINVLGGDDRKRCFRFRGWWHDTVILGGDDRKI